ncbi:glycosyltransferase family 4 protein [Flavobacterium limi]|uniref:Glycosyl transferase family 1 domain-containing protein n=1 Tax=Flavobacterium limi TaxID=2045105 RepID=A0ABQ1U1H3_9FLAO|nr:glycosyltransferase family 4 protein [Flavobacterium limi]GGF08145.1 hypothetical protein GCM10011518_16730 [Flavobacterium limi]
MKKILVYTENYQRGGGNQYLVDIINNIPKDFSVDILSNKGGIFKEDFNKIRIKYTYHEINILSIYNLYDKIKTISESKFLLFFSKTMVYFFKYFLFFAFKKINFKRIEQFIEDENYNLVICCNGGYPGGLTCLDCVDVAESKNIKVWLTVVSMPQTKSVIDFIYKGIFQKVDKLIVNSAKIAEEFLKTRSVAFGRLEVLYNCLPNDSIDIIPEAQVTYDVTMHEYILGYVGRIEKSKGIFYLLDAFAQLLPHLPNLKLVMVGSGIDLEFAKTYCITKGIQEKVEFTGFYAGDISVILKRFNLFVFPSLWEGLPYSVLEAMANSRLVVSTNVGGIPEIIEDGVNGFLVPAANSKLLTEKIKYVLGEFKDYDEVVKNSLNTIKYKFSENSFSKGLKSFFDF